MPATTAHAPLHRAAPPAVGERTSRAIGGTTAAEIWRPVGGEHVLAPRQAPHSVNPYRQETPHQEYAHSHIDVAPRVRSSAHGRKEEAEIATARVAHETLAGCQL